MSLAVIYMPVHYFGRSLLLWQQVVLISQLEGDTVPGFLASWWVNHRRSGQCGRDSSSNMNFTSSRNRSWMLLPGRWQEACPFRESMSLNGREEIKQMCLREEGREIVPQHVFA